MIYPEIIENKSILYFYILFKTGQLWCKTGLYIEIAMFFYILIFFISAGSIIDKIRRIVLTHGIKISLF